MVGSKWIVGAGLAFLWAATAGAGTPSFPASATGDWAGTVRAKDAPRHLFLHIHKTHTGYMATLDSPEGPAGGVEARPIAAGDGVLAFAADGGQFRGRWNDADGRWEGTWTEGGVSARLTLSFNDDSVMRTIIRPRDDSPAVEPSETRRIEPPEVVPPSAR